MCTSCLSKCVLLRYVLERDRAFLQVYLTLKENKLALASFRCIIVKTINWK